MQHRFPHVLLVQALVLPLALLTPPARAAGPMTHMAEAETAVALLRDEAVTGFADLADLADAAPAARLHLLLGSFLPDLRETSDAIRFPTHSREFARWLLDHVASDPSLDPAHRLLALGVAAHVCSDISAQIFQVPYFMATGRVGAPDVMPGLMDDRPDGEGELLVEAIIDVYYGDVDTLLAVYDHFLPDPPQPARLETALDWWLRDAETFFGTAQTGDATTIKQEINATLGRVVDELTPQRRNQLIGALDLAQTFNLGDVLILVDGVGLLDTVVSQGYEVELDYGEIYRLQEVSPFFGDEEHFEAYPEDLAALGPRILLDAARGDPWLEQWPTWRAPPLAAAAVQSLADIPDVGFHPTEDSPASLGEIGVYDLRWRDHDTGLEVTEVTTATPLALLDLEVALYPLVANATPRPVALRIRKAVPGAPYLAGPVIASRTVALDSGATQWRGAAPATVTLTLDVGLAALVHAEGFHAELAHLEDDADGTPIFTTAWEPFPAALPDWPLDRPIYRSQFSTYDHFPRSVRVGPLMPDQTPPTSPVVDATPDRLRPTGRLLTVTVRPGEYGGDGESGILGYEISLGTALGANDVLDASFVPASGAGREGVLVWNAPEALVAAEGVLHVTARAQNGAGLMSAPAHGSPVALGPEPSPRKTGCGCHADHPSGPSVLWVVLFVLGLLRRQRL